MLTGVKVGIEPKNNSPQHCTPLQKVCESTAKSAPAVNPSFEERLIAKLQEEKIVTNGDQVTYQS